MDATNKPCRSSIDFIVSAEAVSIAAGFSKLLFTLCGKLETRLGFLFRLFRPKDTEIISIACFSFRLC